MPAAQQQRWLEELLARRAARVASGETDAPREHTYHRVIAAERLRRSLAARPAESAPAEGAPAAAPSEASAFAETLRTGGGAAGAALLALRLLPTLGGRGNPYPNPNPNPSPN